MLKTVSTISGFVSPTFSGDVTLSNGNLVIGTSGKGIDFSATPGTGTSELLADYEEGTFTPVIQGGTTTGTGTYTTQNGRYTKIGNRVYFNLRIRWTAHTGTGAIRVAGLPFIALNAAGSPPGIIIPNEFSYAASSVFAGQVIANTSYIETVTVPVGGTYLGATDLATTTLGALDISGHYEV